MTTVLVSRPDLLLGVSGLGATGEPDAAFAAEQLLDVRHTGPDGRTAVGALGVLVDDALGYSLIESLPVGSWTVSTEIWIDVLGPLPTTGRLRARARTAQTGSYAVGTVTDETGRLLVHARERGRRIDDVPDVAAHQVPSSAPAAGAGLAATIGLGLGEVSELAVGPDLENPRRMLHGGISLAAAELAATASRLRAGSDLTTSSVHCVHTRAAPYGSVVEVRVVTVHAGRSLWISDVTGTVGGRPVVLARVSAQ